MIFQQRQDAPIREFPEQTKQFEIRDRRESGTFWLLILIGMRTDQRAQFALLWVSDVPLQRKSSQVPWKSGDQQELTLTSCGNCCHGFSRSCAMRKCNRLLEGHPASPFSRGREKITGVTVVSGHFRVRLTRSDGDFPSRHGVRQCELIGRQYRPEKLRKPKEHTMKRLIATAAILATLGTSAFAMVFERPRCPPMSACRSSRWSRTPTSTT